MLDNNKVFSICIRTRGGLQSSFVFSSVQESEQWKEEFLPALEAKYGMLELTEDKLPALKVGDHCNVYGEGADVFVIKALRKLSPCRYAFCLDNGCREEVAKCHVKLLSSTFD